jgi:diguanylate cyclase (GGDEF)-like protein
MNWTAVVTAAGVAYALGWLTRQPEVAEARREANTDKLTGLVSRQGLQRQLHIRAGLGQPYTLYFIDLNGFKPINDTFGHRAGDSLLRQLGGRLRAQLAGNLVARIGGDEFVVVGPGLHEGTALLLSRIKYAIEGRVAIPGSPEPVTLSAAVGYVHAPAGTTPSAALHTADLAMYRSKQYGFPSRGEILISSAGDGPPLRIRDARTVRVA